MNSSSFFNPDEALEQGKAVLQRQAQATVQSVKGQVVGISQPQASSGQNQAAQDQSTNDFLGEMYGTTSDKTPPHQQSAQHQSLGAAVLSQLKGPTQEEDQAKLAEARKRLRELHAETYYQPLFNRPKQEGQGEKVEREENEEKQKRWELQQKEQAKAPIAVTMATNKAEQFRGAAG